MTYSTTAKTVTNIRNNQSVTVNSTAQIDTPFYFLIYNPVTLAIVGKAQYRTKGTVGDQGNILACDTFANLQAEAASLKLVGNIGTNPTPKA